jgi:hypothetical protein
MYESLQLPECRAASSVPGRSRRSATSGGPGESDDMPPGSHSNVHDADALASVRSIRWKLRRSEKRAASSATRTAISSS